MLVSNAMRSFALIGFTGLLAAASCTRAPGQPPMPSSAALNPEVVDGVSLLRVAAAKYRNLDSAVAAGYPRTVAQCLVHEHHGAMGYHHMNRAYLDNKVEIDKPEILLYERLADSSYRLNGVEYIVPFARWPRDSTPPVLMGRRMYREDNLKIWYMHVWAFKDNRDGLFANFNPSVRCRGSDSRVYVPTADSVPATAINN